MSISDINPESVLAAIRAGMTTRADLAERFEVLPSSSFLQQEISQLRRDGRIVEHSNGHLHVNDLIETLPHNEED